MSAILAGGGQPARAAAPRERFVYFIQSHRAPEQVARLVRTLRRLSPDAHILVGHDGRRVALERRDLGDVPGVDLFAASGAIERGELSVLQPYFQAVRHLAAERIPYDWLVYLSGQDYPTRPLAACEAELASSSADGFLTYWNAFLPENPWGRRRQGVVRYGYRYRRLKGWLAGAVTPLRALNGVQHWLHIHRTYGTRIGVRARRTPFHDGFLCYAGSLWTTLRRSCAELVEEEARSNAGLVSYFERTICPDEAFPQTVLVNRGSFRLVNDALRFIDFTGSRDGSPRTLRESDLPALLSGTHHFARKFDVEIDSAVLDRLDEHLFAS